DPLIDLLDHLQQIGTGLSQVLELLAEELVALLQRRELLERQRVDLAELLVGLLRGAQTLLLFGADLRAGLGLRRFLALGRRRRRNELVGAVLGDEAGRFDA